MATPRQTRSASHGVTPLPAVDTRQSHAYGAKGKAALGNQVVAATTTFAEGFTTGREASGATTIPEESEERWSTRTPPMREGTVVESLAHYEDSRVPTRATTLTGRARAPLRTTRLTSPPPVNTYAQEVPRSPPPPPHSAVPSQVAEPWNLMVLLLSVPRYLWRNFWAVILGALLLLTLNMIPLSSSLELHRDRMVKGMKIFWNRPGYDLPPTELEKVWLDFRYRDMFTSEEIPSLGVNLSDWQWQVNLMYLSRIEELEQRVDYLESNVTMLKNEIPPLMVVDIVDGEQVIKEDFWTALRGKMEGDAVLWENFVTANKQTLRDLTKQAASAELDGAISKQRVLTQEKFQLLMDENTRRLAYEFSQELQDSAKTTLRDARELVVTVAAEISEKAPKDAKEKFMILKKAIILQNTYHSLANVNHLSPILGARVDPYHTSPTLKISQQHGFGFWRYSTDVTYSPAVNALLKWDEVGECWCAAHSEEHGKAQLAVKINHDVMPDQFYIEHTPAPGSFGIASAPRDFEVWADAVDEEQASMFRARIAEYYEDFSEKPYPCIDSTPPTESAVCIGQGTYNIHNENWVQQWPTIINMKQIGFVTSNIYFRITSNWGADHTCIYRVRLGSQDMEGTGSA